MYHRSTRIAATLAVIAGLAGANAAASTLTTLYNFQGLAVDGELPDALILQGGQLYGTTQIGGSANCYVNQYEEGCGTVFKVDPSTGKETLLTAFNTAGENPQTIAYVKGKLLVPTFSDSNLFRLGVNGGTPALIHHFGGGPDGNGPTGPVVDAKGILYGATGFGGGTGCGGNAGCGVIYALNTKTKAETVLYQFLIPSNGQNPQGVVLLNNALYGVTAFGGNTGCTFNVGCGLVFKIDLATGTESVLHTFTGHADGGNPILLIAANNTLYGSASVGGLGAGTLFQIDPATGAETVLYSFQGKADGAAPNSIVYVKQAIYGTGGTNTSQNGALIEFDLKQHKFSSLYTFSGGNDGSRPSTLIYGGGKFYGATYQGGAYNAGTVFSFQP
jgi:uncharacterized repeat protein (TIGR03803 family)